MAGSKSIQYFLTNFPIKLLICNVSEYFASSWSLFFLIAFKYECKYSFFSNIKDINNTSSLWTKSDNNPANVFSSRIYLSRSLPESLKYLNAEICLFNLCSEKPYSAGAAATGSITGSEGTITASGATTGVGVSTIVSTTGAGSVLLVGTLT